MTTRDEYLSTRFNEFLDRFTPPRAIQNNPKAMQDDADAMLRTVLRYAPKDGYAEWLVEMLTGLADSMTTRSWPAPGELTKACKAKGGFSGASESMTESEAINRMADWFSRFSSQMPGHGNSGRTAELIRRGVLVNEREARFRGFDLSEDQAQLALDQVMGKDEWMHHVRVMARLKGISVDEAAAQERKSLSASQVPQRGPVNVPNKRVAPDVEAFA